MFNCCKEGTRFCPFISFICQHFFFLQQNLNQNPRTLLPKFYGLYCIQSGGINIRLVVMNNVLPRSVKMHYKYDLKGSTYKRRASRKEREKACPTYKDLDFQDMHEEGLYFDTETYNNLMKTLQRDCRVGALSNVRVCVCSYCSLSSLGNDNHTQLAMSLLVYKKLCSKQGSLASCDWFHYRSTFLLEDMSPHSPSCLHSFAKTFWPVCSRAWHGHYVMCHIEA